ncbi:hypothetical protein K7432_010042 [Basidiobolus ranarum]|uniref:Uncharacterized protein n=1 Tax=Basidiobolus ranarum TaxID=34480 RepID=A0ABR2WPE6_9FUNG
MNEDSTLSDSGYSTLSSRKYRSVSDTFSCHSSWSYNTTSKKSTDHAEEICGTSSNKLNRVDTLFPPSTTTFSPVLESELSHISETKRYTKGKSKKEEVDFVWYCKAPPPPKCFPYHNNSVFLPNFNENESIAPAIITKPLQHKIVTRRTSRDSTKCAPSQIPETWESGLTSREKTRNTTIAEENVNSVEQTKTHCFDFLYAAGSCEKDTNGRKKTSLVRRLRSWFVTPTSDSSLKRIPNNHQTAEENQQRKRRKL